MEEGEKSRKVRKTGSPKVRKKSEIVGPESEVKRPDTEEGNTSAPDSYRDNIPQSEIVNNKSEIENPTSEIKTMEVHHHPEVEKKGPKEYLLEGLMIFLAVTMGFFAESIREHLSDRNKEREFMYSMIQDLKADTTTFNKGVKTFTRIFLNVDTMLTCLKSDKPDPVIINHILSKDFWTYAGYSYNNRTVQQLRNSGNFRLIQNNAVADSILKYDNYINTIILNQYSDLKNTMIAYKDIEAKVIHYKDLKQSNYVIKAFSSKDFDTANTQVFITSDKALLSYYYNRLFIHEVLGHTFIEHIKTTSVRAAKLIAFIQKEYHLEDE